MGCRSSLEGQVVQAGDAEHGLVNAVALESAVTQDFPVLQPGQGVFHSGSRPAVYGVLRLLLWAEMRLASSSAVRDEQRRLSAQARRTRDMTPPFASPA